MDKLKALQTNLARQKINHSTICVCVCGDFDPVKNALIRFDVEQVRNHVKLKSIFLEKKQRPLIRKV